MVQMCRVFVLYCLLLNWMYNCKAKMIMNDLIEKIGIDKLCHYGIGGEITAFVAVVAMLQDLPLDSIWEALYYPIMGIVVTIIVEILKEYVIDKKADKMDFLWTMLGAFTVFMAFLIGILFNVLAR